MAELVTAIHVWSLRVKDVDARHKAGHDDLGATCCPPPLQLRRKTHPAGPAARAAHGDEDALLLLVVEVGAVEHGAGLALEEFVERQVAGDDAVVGGEGGGVLGRRGGGFSRLFVFFRFRHHWSGSSTRGDPPPVALRATSLPRKRERATHFATFFI